MSVVWTGILAGCLAIVEVVVLWSVWTKRANRPAFVTTVRGLDGLVPERFGAVIDVFDFTARNSRSTAPPGSSSQMANFLIRLTAGDAAPPLRRLFG